MLKAGVSSVDISPEKGVGLAGYPHCPRPNKGVHDPLYAACLYLNDGKKEFVIVTLDLLYFGKKYVKCLREKLGVDIMFSCSHTHSGPWASEVLASELSDGIARDEVYAAQLMEKLEAAVREAISNTFPAAVGTFSGHCGAQSGVGGNRREKGGVCDPSVNVLAVKDDAGDVRACLVNYSLHPTFLHAENELVSADYPAYIRRFLSFAAPKAVTLFAQGTSGNQSSRYHRVGQDFEEATRVGTTIGVEVLNCLNKMKFENDIKICAKSEEISLSLKEYPPIEVSEAKKEEARELFEALKAEYERGGDYIKMRNAELALFGAENTLSYSKLAAKGYKSGELPCELQVLTVGNTVIAAVQGEVFVEFGLKIKEISPYDRTFVFTVSNGALPGYVYTKEAGEEGGYEIGTSMLTFGAGEEIVNKIKEMIL